MDEGRARPSALSSLEDDLRDFFLDLFFFFFLWDDALDEEEVNILLLLPLEDRAEEAANFF